MDPVSRGKVMDAIKAKYDAVRSLPAGKRREATLAFLKTLPSVKEAVVTDDGNISCAFTDGMPYVIMESICSNVPQPPPVNFDWLFGRVERLSGSKAIGPLPNCSVAQFQGNDLPLVTRARICNTLGPGFGNGSQTVRTLLAGHGYDVIPGEDASLYSLEHLGVNGVFLLCTHGGNCRVWDKANGKWTTDYILSTGEEWNETKDKIFSDLGMVRDGLIGTCQATYDFDLRTGKPIDKRFFTITRAFIKKYWKFSKNSFVAVHACTSYNLKDVMATADVNASVFMGYNDLGIGKCLDGVVFLFDRMLGANDPGVQPQEAGWPQRPFDYNSIDHDMRRKGLFPVVFAADGARHSCSPQFGLGRDDFGLLAPSIQNMSPLPHQRKFELVGMFGEDPGEKNRSVTLAGVAMPIDKWTPTKIIAYLPNSENESHGEVKVFHMGRASNSRWLSNWKGSIEVRIRGNQTLALNADFLLNWIADPWPYREQAGDKPVYPMVWPMLSSIGSTCSWVASGQEDDGDGHVLKKWSGNGNPRVWLDENMGTAKTFGVGGVGDSYQKHVNIFLAIIDTLDFWQGSSNPNTPVKLGDWNSGQTLIQPKYDQDFNILGDTLTIDDEPSRLSYGAHSGSIKWTSMQCRYPMPKNAPR